MAERRTGTMERTWDAAFIEAATHPALPRGFLEVYGDLRDGYINFRGERLPVERVEYDGDTVTVYIRRDYIDRVREMAERGAHYRIDRVRAMAEHEAYDHAQYAARVRAAHEAEYTAERLLMSNLSPEQRMDFLQHRHFNVISQSGKRFRIHMGRSQNIYGLDRRGEVISTHCIVAERDIPICDQLLMQKLMLEYDEQGFMREAVSRFLEEEARHRGPWETAMHFVNHAFDYRT